MSTLLHPDQHTSPVLPVRTGHIQRLIDGLGFDWAMIGLGLLFLGGLYLDGLSHNHGNVDDSFFTVWHAFFYTGFALVALLLSGTLVINRLRGCTWQQALPQGYQLSLLGVLIFATGGVGDLIWHELFGIEEDFEALLSPTHLLLGLGLGLVVTGPLRAAWWRAGKQLTWRRILPALLSLSALISTLTFFMMFSHPIFSSTGGRLHREFNNDVGQVAGVIGLMLVGAILVGPVLLALRRWTLPVGSLTVVWGINTVAMTVLGYHHRYSMGMALAMMGAAAVLDLLLWRLRPRLAATVMLRLFAFCAPVFLFSAYYLVLLITEGTRWSVHLITGSVALAGVIGWLLSYLVVPPAMPTGDEANPH
ncbi:MAG: hypothetical protein R3E79_06030 [Caldilineaceae bacterium]